MEGPLRFANPLSHMAGKRHTSAFRRAGCPGSNFDKYWFSPAMNFYLNANSYRGAYKEALEQNEVLYRSDSLVLYVAPWKFQLYRKLSRVAKSIWQGVDLRSADVNDAADLIHRFNVELGRHLTFQDVQSWYQDPAAKLESQAARQAARQILPVIVTNMGGSSRCKK
ncbi:hypothetical protein C8Q79DRAFT_704105 [Trametes meyenii]|nr:hypothetical protein C8Q79DRAFT_704105 [Trametes meyenii]